MSDLENYYFSKQFLLTKDRLSLNDRAHMSHWRKEGFADKFDIFYHPALSLDHAVGTQSEVLCMGELLDPANPNFGNGDIVRALTHGLSDFSALEERLATMAGRWVIVARFGKTSFLYHDAGGLKSVFLYKDDKQGIACVASQPALFAHLFSLERLSERDAEMQRLGASQWPIHIYPYHNVEQLLPNHRLNLSDYAIERYWPREPLSSVAMEDAASEIFSSISDIALAASKRRRCSMALTAGYDSRLLLACTKEFRDQIAYFTAKSPHTPRHDIVIPRALARLWDINYETVDFVECTPEILDVLRMNSSGLYIHPTYRSVCSKAKFVQDGLHLEGSVSEVMRCFFYKDGEHPSISPKELGRRTEFKDNKLAQQGFTKWIKHLPDTNFPLLDLFYWEHRAGVWASASYAFREALVDNCPPMNCRHILETGLGVDIKDRRHPHQLYRRMYSLADKRLLKPDFNTTKRDMVTDKLSRLPLP